MDYFNDSYPSGDNSDTGLAYSGFIFTCGFEDDDIIVNFSSHIFLSLLYYALILIV